MSKKLKILVTGGAGYIGSHTVIQLINNGYDVVIFDNFSNSKLTVVESIKKITKSKPEIICGDLRDAASIASVFSAHEIYAVIHFAGLKAVAESEIDPIGYYDNNVLGSINLIKAMNFARVFNLVFSSSATVYGDPGCSEYSEDLPLKPINVYGYTKLIVEDMLKSICKSNPLWRVVLLRYFNPVGAHISGLIGEDPLGTPNNLMPLIAQVASGQRKYLEVFGNDYPTYDGTCMRDYLHVEDLAAGHIAALSKLDSFLEPKAINLGTGKPYSVFQMIAIFERESGRKIQYKISDRRPGDLPVYFADPGLAKLVLGWVAKYDISRMCKDVWRWQKNANNFKE